MKTENNKNGANYIFVQVVAFVTTLLLVLLFRHFNCFCEFRRGLGLQRWSPVPLLYPIEWLLLLVACISIQAAGFGLLAKGIRSAFSWKAIIVAFVTLICALFLFFRGMPPFRCYLDGFQQRVKMLVKVKDLETWGSSLSEMRGTGQAVQELREKDKPQFLEKFAGMKSPSALVYFGSDGTPQYALLAWGGGFSRYGIFISIGGMSPLGDRDFYFVPWSSTNKVYFFVSGGRTP
jgi:hypothetical protein